MHLSKKAEYALRSMIHLGIATELGLPTVSGADLAEANRLPLKFVERILGELREASIVDAKRGKSGGYFLAKPASQIGIGEIVRAQPGIERGKTEVDRIRPGGHRRTGAVPVSRRGKQFRS